MEDSEIIDLESFSEGIFNDFTKDIKTSNQKNKTTNKTPVIIISGFLGSGKTTLLNNVLRSAKNLKIGVIINDFGKINIDSKLTVGNVSEKTIGLSNGCICCMLGDNGLKEPLDTLANKKSQPDVILIEASGIAEPYDLMQTLRFSGNEFTRFGGNLYVVDSSNYDYVHKTHNQYLEKCLKTSDIILLNKIDLIDPETKERLKKSIKNLNQRAPLIESANGNLDIRLLFDVKLNSKTTHHKNTHHDHSNCHHDHIHSQYQSVIFNSKEPLNPKQFMNFLDNIPENIFRAKGFCYFGIKGLEQKYLIQIVGNSVEITSSPWENQERPISELVLIGAGINETSIISRLKETIDPNPNVITDDMINLERYIMSQ